MKITLATKDNVESEINVNEEEIKDAVMIKYEGRYYAFNRLQSEKFYRPRFMECIPPVEIKGFN